MCVGADLSESASVSEENLATCLIADLSVPTALFTFERAVARPVGLRPQSGATTVHFDFATLSAMYAGAPGLVTDKIKAVLEFAWEVMRLHGRGRIVFAHDEAQNLSDHASKNEFPLSVLLDVFIQQFADGMRSAVPVDGIQQKLDSDFFAGRWAKTTDRQRELLWVVAHLEKPGGEFAPQELVAKGQRLLVKPFSPSRANQMLGNLNEQGLIHKNRFGRYSFAVPLLSSFILRTFEPPTESLRFG